ncbi:hypothetical protein HK405_005244, partial [Cladochytrium tenue]
MAPTARSLSRRRSGGVKAGAGRDRSARAPSAMDIDGGDRSRTLATDPDNTLTPAVLRRYVAAAAILREAMTCVLGRCVPDAKVADICRAGDAVVLERTAAVRVADGDNGVPATTEVEDAGIAMPTCVSPGRLVTGFCPLETEPAKEAVLRDGDLVTVELGVHVDGYPVTAAHTMVVRSDGAQGGPIEGRLADAVCAAHIGAEVVARMLRPGVGAQAIVRALNAVARAFDVRLVEGTASTLSRRFLLEAEEVVRNTNVSDDEAPYDADDDNAPRDPHLAPTDEF